MNAQKRKAVRTGRRKHRVRAAIRGTAAKPRLSVYRSNLHIYAQLIDDENQVTLAAAGSNGKDAGIKYGGNAAAAAEVGKKLAAAATAKGITEAAFDRGGYRFHGRVKALARAATQAGLKCTGLEEKVKKEAAPAKDVKAPKAKGGGDGEKKKGEKKKDKEPAKA